MTERESKKDNQVNVSKKHADTKPARSAKSECAIAGKCGGCAYLGLSYEEQLKKKQAYLEGLLKPYVKPAPIIGMDEPKHYRNKVNAAFAHDHNGNPISGMYEANSHRVLQTDGCLLEDEKASRIIVSIRRLLKSFKITTYSEGSGYGLLRHVQVRTGHTSGEIMVVLVCTSPVFPSKNNFVKALLKEHPEITTIILNVNDRDTTMVLGERNITLYGPGFVFDTLCGVRFKISPGSFYQVNPVQTELLYNKAMEFAALKKGEKAFDAYCGIGTIGLIAAKTAGKVIGVELNKTAVKDAVGNAKGNKIENAEFYSADAGEFLEKFASEGGRVDCLFLDPPRSGSTETFIKACGVMSPQRIVYVSCGPETLARDLGLFAKQGYHVEKAVGVDMFPWTEHVESVTLLERN